MLVPVLLPAVAWVGLLESGVDPIILGLAVELATSAYGPSRGDLEEESSLFLGFRPPPAQFERSGERADGQTAGHHAARPLRCDGMGRADTRAGP
ncbi:hypothetical protein [Planotetraspora kaengkrachanensis]|uniref:Uncharacterized protein n=1 Tax=Planotetraspora kaengkrachanensis TaxID=575193 RepID=A0A8J3VAU7_9ACTN|nr:hypothetical protein [Planotetraspora kaengkrachanensis]GIG84265.1 hypothetical protein Pka01_73920 [Planotetraspora kaengkrachanensis]